MNNPESPSVNLVQKRRKKAPWIVLGALVVIALVIFFLWLFKMRFTVTTNDAYVHGNQVEVFPKINSTITSIYAEETQFVEEGDLLIELDPTDAQLQLEKSMAHLANTVRGVVQKFDHVYQLKAALSVRETQVVQAQIHYNNRAPLVEAGAITAESFQDAEIAICAAKAALEETIEQLRSAEAQIYNTTIQTHPLVLQASEQVRASWLNLARTKVYAPVKGYIAQRGAQVGESAAPNRSLLSIVPLDEIWVNANFKEVQLADIQLGQKVTLTSSLYGDRVKYVGKVMGISPGTGSVFSVLPPQNASGNWIKIVQRVPVKLQLDQNEIQKNPLRVGLTMHVSVNLKDKPGKEKVVQLSNQPIYSTQIFEENFEEIDTLIQQIIEQNVNPMDEEAC